MKSITTKFSALLFIVFTLNSVQAQFDDLYYDADDYPTTSTSIEEDTYEDQSFRSSNYDDASYDDYDYYEDEYDYYDEYDYSYSTRINRFRRNRTFVTTSYYSPFLCSSFATYDPWYNTYYDPFYYNNGWNSGSFVSINLGYSWGWNNWGFYNNWNNCGPYAYSGWGWNNPYNNYWNYYPYYNHHHHHGGYAHHNHWDNNSNPSPHGKYYGSRNGGSTYSSTKGKRVGPRSVAPKRDVTFTKSEGNTISKGVDRSSRSTSTKSTSIYRSNDVSTSPVRRYDSKSYSEPNSVKRSDAPRRKSSSATSPVRLSSKSTSSKRKSIRSYKSSSSPKSSTRSNRSSSKSKSWFNGSSRSSSSKSSSRSRSSSSRSSSSKSSSRSSSRSSKRGGR